MDEKTIKNKLAEETSPYLLAHADNPVAWHPWGQEAINKARREGKPIFLSIGYSACHWCHVMEKESFENKEIAAILNKHFVSIKVDREERPDIDALYMRAVQMMTGAGGWPLSVFLTPDLKPFFGGTYFPPQAKGGHIGFKEILLRLAEAYQTQGAELAKNAEYLTQRLSEGSALPKEASAKIEKPLLAQAAKTIIEGFDPQYGGHGQAPKFPSPPMLGYLLAYASQNRPFAAASAQAVLVTLDNMAQGGLYDHLGGGFHRYSTDARWFAPHFEKMLYDNAQLARLYLEAWQLTGRPRYQIVARRTLDYLLREMTAPEGGFYASQDADSNGQEGYFYTWTWTDLESALGHNEEKLELIGPYFHATPQGNWEHSRNILYGDSFSVDSTVEALRHQLFAWRQTQRQAPDKDIKILADWNALAVASLAYAGKVFNHAPYIEAARQAEAFILSRYGDAAGNMAHGFAGKRRISGFLEDYVYWALAEIELYEATLDLRYLHKAKSLTTRMIDLFYDPKEQDFFSFPTQGADPYLLSNMKENYDGVTPSGNAVAAHVLLRMGRYFEDERFNKLALGILETRSAWIRQTPGGAGRFLSVLLEYFEEPWQVEIAGDRKESLWQELWSLVNARWWPGRLSAWLAPNKTPPVFSWTIELDGAALKSPKVYLCRGRNCLLPSRKPEELAAFLDEQLPRIKLRE